MVNYFQPIMKCVCCSFSLGQQRAIHTPLQKTQKQCLPQIRQSPAELLFFCFESHKKYRKHGLCHRASFRKPESMCEVEQEGDANTLSTGGILGSSPGPSSSGDWLSLVTDNTRFHFQVTRLSSYHFSSAFTLLS